MKPQFIIIAILITLKVIGVASRANADYFCHYKDKDYGFGYNSDGFNEPYRCGDSPSLKRI